MMMTMMMCRKGEYKDLDNDHKDDDDKIISRKEKIKMMILIMKKMLTITI